MLKLWQNNGVGSMSDKVGFFEKLARWLTAVCAAGGKVHTSVFYGSNLLSIAVLALPVIFLSAVIAPAPGKGWCIVLGPILVGCLWHDLHQAYRLGMESIDSDCAE